VTVDQQYRASTQLTEAELNALREFWQVCEPRYEELVADIAADAREHQELGILLGGTDPSDVRETRELLARAIMDGDWSPYLARMGAAGVRYAEAGLDFTAWFAAGRALRSRLTPMLVDALSDEAERLAEAVRGVAILIDLVLFAVGQTYISAKERIITEQQVVLRELSTPVLELRPGLLLVPLVGLIDSERALLLTQQLLEGISAYRAKAVVLDITGVPAVDSAVANHLMQTVQATRLMGAHTLISGLSAENAQTLVRLGLDLAPLNTVGTLADGVLQAAAILAAAEDRVRRYQATPTEP
jgi:anti-anti-sigma regulatory factor